jgi:hypothetical protein
MSLPPDLVEMLSAFADAEVHYLVVGGHAVSVHARPRSTKDLDLWLRSTPENIERACGALRRFGVPPTIVEALRTSAPDEIVWMGRAPARIDFLQTMPGVEFGPAWQRRVIIETAGVPIYFIGRDDLIANKRIVGRPQDRRDVRALERAARSETSTPAIARRAGANPGPKKTTS